MLRRGSFILAVAANAVLGFLLVTALFPDARPPGVEIREADYGERWPFEAAQAWLRCEGAGGVVVNVGGKDYALNGMASARFAPIAAVRRDATDPAGEVGPLISRGLALCEW